MKKILALDSFRFFASIFIILHHIGINIYVANGLPNPYFNMAHLALEGFFILSGFLIAKSYSRLDFSQLSEGTAVKNFFINRIKRLWPEYMFALIICLILTPIFAHSLNIAYLPLNIFFLGGWNTTPGLINGIWYVIVLFWGGAFLFSLMTFYKDKAFYLWLPIIALVCMSYMIIHFNAVSGNQFPIEFGLVSRGLIRGLLGMLVGIFTYKICEYLKTLNININKKLLSISLLILEILSLSVIVYLLIYEQSYLLNSFNIYFASAFIIGLLYFGKEKILKFLSWNIWTKISCWAYMIYLTHLVVLECLGHQWKALSTMSPWLSYPILVICCVIFGGICYNLQKILSKKIIKVIEE